MSPQIAGPGTTALNPASTPRTETPTVPGGAALPADLLARIRAGDRDAAAAFLDRYGPLVRRRVRGKLGQQMRRVFDSQDLWSTLARRFDRFVQSANVSAESEAELVSLLHRMIDSAVVDKFRAFSRMADNDLHALPAAVPAPAVEAEPITPADVEAAIASLPDPVDREILVLWLQGIELQQIADQVGRTPAAVRQRWQSIRAPLRRRWFPESRA